VIYHLSGFLFVEKRPGKFDVDIDGFGVIYHLSGFLFVEKRPGKFDMDIDGLE
jgi:hypothetical protein